MLWYRLDVGTVTHPKLLELTPDQRWRWLTLLDHCAAHHTDGTITTIALKRLGITPRLRARLLELTLLEPAGHDLYRLHDWELHNGRNEAARDAARERKRAERERKRKQFEPDRNEKEHKTATRDTSIHAENPQKSRVTSRARARTDTGTTTKQAKGPKPPARPSASLPAGQLETIGTSAEGELERLRGLVGEPPSWDVDEDSEGHEAA